MNIYKNFMLRESILRGKTQGDEFWSVTPPEGSIVITDEYAAEYLGKQYSLLCDTSIDFTTKMLMKIMYEKLSFGETKIICDAEPWIEKLFKHYIAGMHEKELEQKLTQTENAANDAEALAATSMLQNLLK